jgi:hypothetical protein
MILIDGRCGKDVVLFQVPPLPQLTGIWDNNLLARLLSYEICPDIPRDLLLKVINESPSSRIREWVKEARAANQKEVEDEVINDTA